MIIQLVSSLLFGICGNECSKLFFGEAEDGFHGTEEVAGVGDMVACRFFFPRGVKVAVQFFSVCETCPVGKVPAHFFVPVGEILIGVADQECRFS